MKDKIIKILKIRGKAIESSYPLESLRTLFSWVLLYIVLPLFYVCIIPPNEDVYTVLLNSVTPFLGLLATAAVFLLDLDISGEIDLDYATLTEKIRKLFYIGMYCGIWWMIFIIISLMIISSPTYNWVFSIQYIELSISALSVLNFLSISVITRFIILFFKFGGKLEAILSTLNNEGKN